MFAADYEACHAEGCPGRATRTHLAYPVCADPACADQIRKGHPMSAANVYPAQAHLRPGATLAANVHHDGGPTVTLRAELDHDRTRIATVFGEPEHTPSMIHALLNAAHDLMREADLDLARWDACLRGLDALTETAANRRAEAFYAEHGDGVDRDWLTYPTTDHVRDGHVEGPGDGLCDSCASARENAHLVGHCEQARRELAEGVG